MNAVFGRWSILSLLIASLLVGCAEVVEEGRASGPKVEIDGKQVRHGIWVETFEDGSRKSHGRYTRGIKTGLHRSWHPSGQLAEERRYDWEGRMHEKQVDFNEDGERISKVFYEHGEEQVEDEEEDAEEEISEVEVDEEQAPVEE